MENREELRAIRAGRSTVFVRDLKIGDKFIDQFCDLAEIIGFHSSANYIVRWINQDVTGVSTYEEVEENATLYGDSDDSEILSLLETRGVNEGNYSVVYIYDTVHPYEKWIPDTKLARKLYKIIEETDGKLRIL